MICSTIQEGAFEVTPSAEEARPQSRNEMTEPSAVHGVRTTFCAWQALRVVLFLLIILSEGYAASAPERKLIVGTKEVPPFAMKLIILFWIFDL